MIYPADAPRDAAFYPFAAYSPEWVALRFAVASGVQARFMDLPRFPGDRDGDDEGRSNEDPLGAFARIAGHDDGESWWDTFVESRDGDAEGVFEAVADAMAAMRDGTEATGREAMREAHMRAEVRDAFKGGAMRVAAVCGAWHVPAVLRWDARGQATEDARLLKGLPRARMQACWAPWSYERLASEGGYAAGVTSPEWYHLLWESRGDPTARWLANAASLMRAADLPASPASVIEAARLARSLAAMRDRTRPLLSDLREAALSVLCEGDAAPMGMIHRRLVVGERLGAVPEAAARTPVEADFAAACKAARLKPEAGFQDLLLDLRKPLDLSRSHLLNRLAILDLPWGRRQEAKGAGTYKEGWALKWEPEFAVRLVAAAAWGSTVAEAASVLALHKAAESVGVAVLAATALSLLDADLPEASEGVVRMLTDRAAEGGDVADLMKAVPPLASLVRYGSVRGADPAPSARWSRGSSSAPRPGSATPASPSTRRRRPRWPGSSPRSTGRSASWRTSGCRVPGGARSPSCRNPTPSTASSPAGPPGSYATRGRWRRPRPAAGCPSPCPGPPTHAWPRDGSRASSPAAGRSWSTTGGSSGPSTSGCAGSTRRPSSPSCRSSGAPSRRCHRRSAGASRNRSRRPPAPLPPPTAATGRPSTTRGRPPPSP